ncbi:MAG: LysR family transcriptional regulator [Deltaproteobacteria bacterium]|nr:LysR family transcriptional regulator [Deltaproteobacteria bacterium]
MNLRDLEYIKEIAKSGSMVRAASNCHVSQSTLSIQLKKLEEELDVQIFERSKRRLISTAIGQKIIAHAEQILQLSSEIKLLAKQAKDPFAGELKLGAFPTLAPYWFPLIIPYVKKTFPALHLQLIEEKTHVLIEKLKTGKIDCAALALPIEEPDFTICPLFTEPFYLALPHQHKLSKKKTIKADDIVAQGMMLLEDGHCLRGQALKFCTEYGISESHNYRAASLETLRNMVIAGEGLTIIPELAIRNEDKHLSYLPFKQGGHNRSIALCWRKSSFRQEFFPQLATALKGITLSKKRKG